MIKNSRIAVGFNRLGIFLSVPVLLVAAFVSVNEWAHPSGRYVTTIPKGANGWQAERVSADQGAIVQSLISEQLAVGIDAPKGIVVVGIPLGVERQDETDWTKYQLRDGREIGVASTDQKVVSDTAFDFLFQEKAQGRAFTDKDTIDLGGVRVRFLNPFDQFRPAKSPWPKQQQHNWTFALLLGGLGAGLYVLARAAGWVIEGFAGSRDQLPRL